MLRNVSVFAPGFRNPKGMNSCTQQQNLLSELQPPPNRQRHGFCCRGLSCSKAPKPDSPRPLARAPWLQQGMDLKACLDKSLTDAASSYRLALEALTSELYVDECQNAGHAKESSRRAKTAGPGFKIKRIYRDGLTASACRGHGRRFRMAATPNSNPVTPSDFFLSSSDAG